ncbi:MAG: LysR family transcriptional regulator [Pseudomonadota bacterium]
MARADQGRLTLRAIEIFVAVVEEGSLGLGARRLGASPSSVSQQISNLEAVLGARLIDRTARPFALTPAGYVFQRRALAILDEAMRAQSELAELELTRLPQLRLAVVEDFDADLTPELVARLSAMLPGCNIIAHSGQSHRNLAALDARAEDIVVAATEERAEDWIEVHPLLRDPYLLVTAPGLLDRAADPIQRLLAAPMVRYTATQRMGQQIDTHLRRLRLAPPRRFEFDTDHAVMAMVVRAEGWAFTTALGYLRARRFHGALDAHPMPMRAFSRQLALHARRDVLGGLPGRAAEILRDLIAAEILPAAARAIPWLGERLRILGLPDPPIQPAAGSADPAETPSATILPLAKPRRDP